MKPIRVLALLEASTVTGPAKNLLEFARLAREPRFDPQIEVTIATFRREGDSRVFLDAAEAAQVPVHAIPERGRFDRSVIQRLRSLSGELSPDIIQTHAVKSHFLLRSSGLQKSLPWVAFHHGYTWPDMRAQLYNQLDRWSLPAARRIVTVSIPFREELADRGVDVDRISVLHNAIDPNWAAGARESQDALRMKLGIPLDRRVALIVGRLSKEKDHLILLDAIASLHDQSPHLLIVGEGPERPLIEERIRTLNLSSRVTMTGQVPTAQPYYGVADVAVLSSRSEGSPNALLEAMAARVPVVATTVGGIPEMVKNWESALLVAPADKDALTQAISAALSDDALAESLRTNAYELVKDAYSPDQRVRTLSEIYRHLL